MDRDGMTIRLLMTTDTVGGVWQYSLDLAAALAPLGFETTLAVLGPAASPAQHLDAQRAPGSTLVETGLPLDWLCGDAAPVLAAGDAIAALAQREGADVVQLNMPSLGARARFTTPVVAVAHGCIGTWWEAAKGTRPDPAYRWQDDLVSAGLIAADAVVAPSASYAATVARYHRLSIPPLAVHNGRVPFGLPHAPPGTHVFTAGRLWDLVKNTMLLDRTAARLSVPFRAAGAEIGPHGEHVEAAHLHPLGQLDAAGMARELAQRPIFVSAARFEPFGLAVLEAAAAGCPLVLSEIGTFRELWSGAALFVDREDDAAYAAAITRLLDDPDLRMRLGEAARVRAERYTPAAMAGRDGGDLHRSDRLLAAVAPGRGMKIVYFTHSLLSCWNHGNAHFLRGVLRELITRGHDVSACEPTGNWSLVNLLADAGDEGLEPFRKTYPELQSTSYDDAPDALVEDADLVIVHEWNDPALVATLGRMRARGAPFRLLFHDTHHRAVSAPEGMQAFDLSGYDGVLAFGETLAEVYRGWGWRDRVWTWHEAADTRLFHPPAKAEKRDGLVWIGNWGDGERTAELERFLFAPAAALRLPLDVYGVRYPDEAKAMLAAHGARYRGWAPNACAPGIFARHLATVHVPRRYYATILPGIPTIRMFEALACGVPLVSAPWDDSEHLFRAGEDYLVASDGAAMVRQLRAVRDDADLRTALVASGLETIRTRHTCAHRVDELLAIIDALAAPDRRNAA